MPLQLSRSPLPSEGGVKAGFIMIGPFHFFKKLYSFVIPLKRLQLTLIAQIASKMIMFCVINSPPRAFFGLLQHLLDVPPLCNFLFSFTISFRKAAFMNFFFECGGLAVLVAGVSFYTRYS